MDLSQGTFTVKSVYTNHPPSKDARWGDVLSAFYGVTVNASSSGNIAGERNGERGTRPEPVAPHGQGSTMGFANRA